MNKFFTLIPLFLTLTLSSEKAWADAFATPTTSTPLLLLAQKGPGKSKKGSKTKNPKKQASSNKKQLAKNKKKGEGKGSKKRRGDTEQGLSFGIQAGAAMEQLTVKNADRENDAFSGFAFQGILAANYLVTESIGIWAGAGPHIVNYTASNEIAALKVNTLSIIFNGGANYHIGSSFEIGGIFEYLMLMSGKFVLESLDEALDIATESKVTAFSRIGFGGQAVYKITPHIRIIGEAMMTTGGLTTEPPETSSTEPENTSVSISGFVFRGSLAYFF